MIGLSTRCGVLVAIIGLACVVSHRQPSEALAGKKEEPKKDAKKDDGKKDEAVKDKKEDKDKKEEPKKEPFKIDVPVKDLKAHNWIRSLAISADGKYVVTSGRDGIVKVWGMDAPKEIQILKPHPFKEIQAVFLDDGAKVATSTGVFHAPKKKKDKAIDKDKEKDKPMGDDKDQGYWEGEIKIWDVKSGKQVGSLKGHSDFIEGLAVSKDGKFLASCSRDQTAKIWDIAAGKDVQTLKGHTGAIFAAAFSADAKRVATASEDKTVRVWDALTGKELLTHSYKAKEKDKSADKDKDKDKEKPKDKDKAKDKEKPKEPEHRVAFTCVAFSPDGKKLVAGNLDGLIKIWDADSDKELNELKAHDGVWAIAFNKDGSRMATGGWDKSVRIWDTSAWKELFGIKAHEGTVTALAFTPDAQRIVSGGVDGVLRFWSATSAPKPAPPEKQ